MLISASYKTDIPTFYGQWFMKRLEAGYCKMVNPYNSHVYTVQLDRTSVDGIVFWTKNAQPFMKSLHEIKTLGYPFIVQYTINGYPRELEQRLVNAQESVNTFRRIAEDFGPKAVIWRYDTILITSLTPVEFHLRNFHALAETLSGLTDEVVVSFAHIYRKTRRNMNAAAKRFGFTWHDPTAEKKRSLLARLVQIAEDYGFQVSVCAQPEFLVPGTRPAHCIDAERLSEISEKPIVARVKGNRPECLCYEARDIGEYDTCPHGCVYCYAVQDRDLAQQRFRKHNPESEFLYEPEAVVDRTKSQPRTKQIPLFPEDNDA